MDRDSFNLSIKILKERKQEFKNEIEFIDDEIKTLKNTYVRENAQFKIDDSIHYTVDNLYYNILSVSINKEGKFIYDLGGYVYTSKTKQKAAIYIDISEISLKKVDNDI